MTPDQEKEIKLLTLNILAVHGREEIVALCAALLGIEISVLRAWLARQREPGA